MTGPGRGGNTDESSWTVGTHTGGDVQVVECRGRQRVPSVSSSMDKWSTPLSESTFGPSSSVGSTGRGRVHTACGEVSIRPDGTGRGPGPLLGVFVSAPSSLPGPGSAGRTGASVPAVFPTLAPRPGPGVAGEEKLPRFLVSTNKLHLTPNLGPLEEYVGPGGGGVVRDDLKAG